MTNKVSKEWFMQMPWGKVAMISWGESSKPPILMVHGYMDTAATFTRLLEHMPDTYYYVSFDFPGHGKSEYLPVAPPSTQTLLVEVVRRIVDHMGWESFIFLAHSMAFVIGLCYNNAFPGRIERMIAIDPTIPLSAHYNVSHNFQWWFKFNYQYYYDSYHKNYKNMKNASKLYTYEQAVAAMMKARSLTREQVEHLLTRCLVPADNGLYRMTFQSATMRTIYSTWLPEYALDYVIKSNPPPAIIINATKHMLTPDLEKFAKKLMKIYTEPSNVHQNVYAEGKHDVHITNPQGVASHIIEFLKRPIAAKSKL
ncbi:serine hydrolase-like protein 2 isoform X1 [Galleria mellonella]|uniref:Serine hydrolase-like protein 2 isoform X1 n=2 Tax=Galleria mellonella TaxID=7137 RepID=A0A6J1WFM8_GALME|nr:serine hydrolase-like protein 2 isoform X1 [Galleria mellonella]